MAQAPRIDVLLSLVPERPNVVLEKLQAHPTLADRQDGHGYSLVHAAASYGHSDLLQALVKDFKVDPNIKDEDGETALFSVDGESAVQITQQLLALGTDINHRNNDGQTAADKLDDEDEQPMVAAYLRQIVAGSQSAVTGDQSEAITNGEQNGVHPPPPLPQGLELNVGTMMPSEAGEEPDPEFRRRIEELAARSDFETEAGQRDLRNLVSDALSGITNEGRGPPATRRRVD